MCELRIGCEIFFFFPFLIVLTKVVIRCLVHLSIKSGKRVGTICLVKVVCIVCAIFQGRK